MIQKKLLVLDVNGFLLDTYFGDSEVADQKAPDAKVGNFLVYKRPFCEEFLQFCLDNFVVGVWSSARSYNVNNLVNFAFGKEKERLAFIWHQSHCTDVGLKSPENERKPLFFKELFKLWNKTISNLPWKVGDFGPFNTLLIDDTPYKAMLNPPNTAIFPCTYTIKDQEDNFLGVALRRYLEGLCNAADVQDYVKCNPFGEPGISSDNPLWECVNQIIPSDTVQNVGKGKKKRKKKKYNTRVIEVGSAILDVHVPSEAVELECLETHQDERSNKDKSEEQEEDKDAMQGHTSGETEFSDGEADETIDVVHNNQKTGECFERDQETSKLESKGAEQYYMSDERFDNNLNLSVDHLKITPGDGAVDTTIAEKVPPHFNRHHGHHDHQDRDRHHGYHDHQKDRDRHHGHHDHQKDRDRHHGHHDHQKDRDRHHDHQKDRDRRHQKYDCYDRTYHRRYSKERHFRNGMRHWRDRNVSRGYHSPKYIHEHRHHYSSYEHHHTTQKRKYGELFDHHKAANTYRMESGYVPPSRFWDDSNHVLMPLRLETSYSRNFCEPLSQQWNPRVQLHGQRYFESNPNQVLVDRPFALDRKSHDSTGLRVWNYNTENSFLFPDNHLTNQPDVAVNQGSLSHASYTGYESWSTGSQQQFSEGCFNDTRWDRPSARPITDRNHSQIESSHTTRTQYVEPPRWKSGRSRKY